MILLPFLVAVIDKEDEFTEDEIISLIKDNKQGVVLKSALIEMYKRKGCDQSKIKALVTEDYLEEESKDYIVATFNYSVEELKNIFVNNDENIDKDLKISDIGRNQDILLEMLNSKTTSEDIEFVIEAMKINPIAEIGRKLAEIYNYNENMRKNKDKNVIAYIIENGIKVRSR